MEKITKNNLDEYFIALTDIEYDTVVTSLAYYKSIQNDVLKSNIAINLGEKLFNFRVNEK